MIMLHTKPHFALRKTKEDEEGGHKKAPSLTTTRGAHHNQTSLRPPKYKGGRRGTSQQDSLMKSIYENNFVLQGCLFARNFCKASRMFLSKSYRLHNTYEIPLYAFTTPTRETPRLAKIKEKHELHQHQQYLLQIVWRRNLHHRLRRLQ